MDYRADRLEHLPAPLAAFLVVGLSTHFWINLILTLLGGIPGMVHALWLVIGRPRGI